MTPAQDVAKLLGVTKRKFGRLRGAIRNKLVIDAPRPDARDVGNVEPVPAVLTSQKGIVEKLWREFFSDPAQWWDHRPEKVNAKFPDFKHKTTQDSLWLNGKFNPHWVEAKLAAMPPGTIQLNLFTWNTWLARYVKSGEFEKAVEIFEQMLREGLNPNTYSIVPVLGACSNLRALEQGRRIHAQIIKSGYEANLYVSSCLVDMYVKCGSIEDAWEVFNKMPIHDVVAWNTMIMGYVKCGQAQKVLDLYRQMQREGVQPSPVIFLGMLGACVTLLALEEGRRVHEQIIQSGCESDIIVGSRLVDMYAKCGSIEDAWTVFKEMPTHDVVAWSAMILGYTKCGQGQKALELFREMHGEDVEPNTVTFVGVLNACADLGALGEGRHLHDQVIRRDYETDVFVGSSLVDMYARCGSIEDAQRVFKKMPMRNVVSWNAMLGGYAMHGHAKEALEHFEWMCQEGVEMNRITFVSLLSACSHGGLVEEGLNYFGSMSSFYSILPAVDHYACMVDLLGRAGRLHEAEDLIKRMSCEPDATIWMSFLAASRVHGNMEVGEYVAKSVLELEPESSAGYVLLSNMYAAAGQWSNSATMQLVVSQQEEACI